MTRIEPDDRGEAILYRTEDGRTAPDVRLAGKTVSKMETVRTKGKRQPAPPGHESAGRGFRLGGVRSR